MGKHNNFVVRPGSRPRLKDYDPAFTAGLGAESEAAEKIEAACKELGVLQDRLMAEETHALLVILQAMDGSGKDGAIKRVASGLDPQGCTAHNFTEPSETENKHDYLWRFHKHVPERGRITFFNRSYYEEVIATRVHPEQLAEQNLPRAVRTKNVWKRRMTEINNFEQYLTDNGVAVLKVFLNLSRRKQAERLLERTQEPSKKWKFSSSDMENRALWDEHVKVHEEMLARTSTKAAPWHIIPADHRWFTEVAVAELMLKKLREMRPKYPAVRSEERKQMEEAERQLRRELKASTP